MNTLSLSEITTIVTNVLASITAFLGIVGIGQWRRQIKYGDQYKTAYRVIGLCLRFKREFGLVRQPTPISTLLRTTANGTDLVRYKAALLDDFKVRHVHLLELFDIVKKLYEESLEVEGYLGNKEVGLTIPLENDYKILSESFGDYRQLAHAVETESCMEEALDKVHKSYEILFSDESDPFTGRIDEAIETIHNRLKKYVK